MDTESVSGSNTQDAVNRLQRSDTNSVTEVIEVSSDSDIESNFPDVVTVSDESELDVQEVSNNSGTVEVIEGEIQINENGRRRSHDNRRCPRRRLNPSNPQPISVVPRTYIQAPNMANNEANNDINRNTNSRARDQSNENIDDIEIIEERPATRSLTPLEPSFQRYQHLFDSRFDNTPIIDNNRRRTTRSQTRSNRSNQISRQFNSDYEAAFQRAVMASSSHYAALGILWPPFGEDQATSNEIESSILARIERDNERQLDQRLQREQIYNRKTLIDKDSIADAELPGYSNDIDPDLPFACELCAVCLGEGIPSDFKPDPRYQDKLEKFQQIYAVEAPYLCMSICTDADRDLSKRIFVSSSCGHVYCGRCVKEIGRDRRKKANNKFDRISSIFKCVAQDCERRFKRKTPFLEIYS